MEKLFKKIYGRGFKQLPFLLPEWQLHVVILDFPIAAFLLVLLHLPLFRPLSFQKVAGMAGNISD